MKDKIQPFKPRGPKPKEKRIHAPDHGITKGSHQPTDPRPGKDLRETKADYKRLMAEEAERKKTPLPKTKKKKKKVGTGNHPLNK